MSHTPQPDGASPAVPQPIRGNEGAPVLGPRNGSLQRENPDLLVPPETDSGTLPNLKYSFDAAHTAC